MSTALLKLERLSPLVFRVLGCNPGPMTLQGTNSYIIGSGMKRILFDTTEPAHPEYLSALKEALSLCGSPSIEYVICSHWHKDHVGAVSDVLSDVCPQSAVAFKFPDRHDSKHKAAFAPLVDGQVFEVEGASIEVLHTPGHTEDHVSLYLKEEHAIFSGDCVLGEGTTVFEDLSTYLLSLKKFISLSPSTMYPGHGPVIPDPVKQLTFYIKHREQRESQILDAISGSDEGFSELDLVDVIYDSLPESVKLAAAYNVRQHLVKLQKENRVIRTEDNLWTGKNHSKL